MKVKVIFDKRQNTEEEIEFFISEFMTGVRYRFGYKREDTIAQKGKDNPHKLCLLTFTQWYKFDCKEHDPYPMVLYAYQGAEDIF